MALAEGSHLGPYEILAPLGAGGMGEVYRARDPRLGREVAIKVLPEVVAQDPERVARFRREARALASLSHPHILDVHDVGSQDGTVYIVSELLEGETLRQHLGRRRLALREAVGYAAQIARGLAAAHEKGVVHRDLKPANLFVTRDGTVKILDFGLAKVARAEPADDRSAQTATAEASTADGRVLGTVDYMSPEQVRGQAVDHRSDIFSFGAVLYEMLTGEPPFRGGSFADTASAIVSKEPPGLATTPRDIPPPLSRIVRRCLEKDPKRRFQSVDDLAFDLEALPKAGRWATQRRRWLLAAGVVAATVAVAAGVLQLRTREPAAPTASPAAPERKRLVVLPFENLGSPEDAYFASGMTEEIMSRLARVSGLGVISRTSAFEYDRAGKTVKEIGDDLGVGYVLEGSVRWERQGDGPGRVRISPRLIRVADDTHLWAEIYDRQLQGIFAAQSEIAEAVVNELGVALLPRERGGVEIRPTESLDAYHAYLRGRELVPSSLLRKPSELAVPMLERAITLDPGFVAAHAALSEAHLRMHRWVDPTPERLDKALASAERAIELDPTAPEGHRALGLYYFLFERRDLDRALDELTRAAELLPNDSSLHLWIGGVLREQGRWNEALTHYEEAVELDPRRPQVLIALGGTYRQLRQYQEAIRYVDLVISLEPDVGEWYLEESAIYRDWGQLEKARETLESAPRMEDDALLWSWYVHELWAGNHEAALDRLADAPEVFVFSWGKFPRALLKARTYDAMKNRESARASYAAALGVVEQALAEFPDDEQLRGRLGLIYAGLGRRDEAILEVEAWLERVTRGGPAYHAWLWELACVYAAAGEPEKALDQLEYLLSIPSLVSYGWLRYSPKADPLRGHPRFRKLLAQAERDLPPPPLS